MGPAIKDVRLAYDSVGSWARPQRAFSMRYFLMGPQLTAEPKGVVLIISPFNLPIFLTLSPLVRRLFPRKLASECSIFAAGECDCSWMRGSYQAVGSHTAH